MQTAVELLKEKLTSVFVNDEGFNNVFEQAKEMEKQQIIDAWKDGYGGDAHSEDEYYNETYGSKGSDVMTPENHIGVLSEAVKKETTSSQTEISDEEIEEQSWGYREVTKDMEIPPNEDWSNGAKWYREQLKQRQCKR